MWTGQWEKIFYTELKRMSRAMLNLSKLMDKWVDSFRVAAVNTLMLTLLFKHVGNMTTRCNVKYNEAAERTYKGSAPAALCVIGSCQDIKSCFWAHKYTHKHRVYKKKSSVWSIIYMSLLPLFCFILFFFIFTLESFLFKNLLFCKTGMRGTEKCV